MKDPQTKSRDGLIGNSAGIAGLLPGVLCIGSALAVAFLMLITVVDVVGRYLFNSPLTGGFEMTEMIMAFIIFSALPMVSLKGGHITVDMLDPILSPRLKKCQAFFTGLVCCGICSIMAWRMWLYGRRLIQRNELTLEFHIAIGNFACALAVLMSITGIVFLAVSCFSFLRRKTNQHKDEE